ncbi:MAG: hypothetical protein JO352_27295 [Chloroflexi bacterium]|nr:hypothetical protein [Chloroflexota bacterium]MBV9602081.1 hypothetical protein [Chloroflexota bacterium]
MRNQQSNALVFSRPSRHAGPDHRITVDPTTLRPLSCTCQAGRRGLLCWAVIEVTATALVPIALRHWQQACGETDIRAAAAVVGQTRKWAAAALELQSLRSCGYVVTERGRADPPASNGAIRSISDGLQGAAS